jgi:hypothetical protein
MRLTLFVILCAISFSASAQFWQSKAKRQPPPPLSIEPIYMPPVVFNTITSTPAIHNIQLHRSIYTLEAAEAVVLKEAKHNMRFRLYNLASYSFSDLAALYVQQNRFSEAKWFLLQSNQISRESDDTRHTLSNLLALAAIKAQLGEVALAKVDLQEAHDIATAKALQPELTEIDKRMAFLLNNKAVAAKIQLRYAEAVEEANNNKAKIN